MGYALSDAEWRLIEPILPCKPRGVPRVDDRRVLNGIFWVLSEGLNNEGVADTLCVMVVASEI
jgi:transposase